MRRQVSLVAAILMMTAVPDDLAAQQTAQRPGEPTGQARKTIPFDEGVIRGRIVDDRSGRPMPDVVVSLSGAEGEVVVHTDSDGRYELAGLTPGSYQLYARAEGYIERRYGQPGPTEAPRVLEVRGGQVTRGVDVRLRRASIVSGRIFDAAGEGFPGVEIAVRHEPSSGAGTGAPGYARTDEEGMFRVGDLAPGSYYVRAHTKQPPPPSDTGAAEVYAATYFPNATRVEDAQPLAVGAGQELFGIDFALVTVETVSIAGTVVDTTGEALDQKLVNYHRPDTFAPDQTVPVSPDGKFLIPGLVPGDYELRVLDPGDASGIILPGTRVSAEGDISDVQLVESRGARIDGRIVTEETTPGAFDLGTLRLALKIRPGGGRVAITRGPAVQSDGTFSIDGVVGPLTLELDGLPEGWSVKAIRLEGTDITYDATDFGEGRSRHVEVVLTDAVIPVTSVSGSVIDRRGRSVSEYTVIVFPENPARWIPPTPFVRGVRARQGGYRIDGLPPADYLAVAVDALPPSLRWAGSSNTRLDWREPDFLQAMWGAATRFRLDEGEQQTLDLRLARTPPGLSQGR